MDASSHDPVVLSLPSRRERPPETRLGRFFLGAHRIDQEEETGVVAYFGSTTPADQGGTMPFMRA
jgi:hypothetical protein